MPQYLILKNRNTGKERKVKKGFNWIFLIFSGFAGIPLFLAGLYGEGFLFAIFFLVGISPDVHTIDGLYGGAFLLIALQLYLGFKGNDLIVSRLLNQRWWVSKTYSDWFIKEEIEEEVIFNFNMQILLSVLLGFVALFNLYAVYSVYSMTDDEKKAHYKEHLDNRTDYIAFLAKEGGKSRYTEEQRFCENNFADDELEFCINDIDKLAILKSAVKSATKTVDTVGVPNSKGIAPSATMNIIGFLFFAFASFASFAFFRESRKEQEA